MFEFLELGVTCCVDGRFAGVEKFVGWKNESFLFSVEKLALLAVTLEPEQLLNEDSKLYSSKK